MNVLGVGVVAAGGVGTRAWAASVLAGTPPAAVSEPLPLGAGRAAPVLKVPADFGDGEPALRKVRRADRFSRMAVLAAMEALRDAGEVPLPAGRTGLILTTAFGPHSTVFRLLDELLDFGDAGVSPTLFSQSVHGAAVSTVATALDLRGPASTLTRLSFAFHEGVRMARAWLDAARCDAVLLGAVDELSPVLRHVCDLRLSPAAEGRLRPLSFSATPPVVPGEGAAFFLLSRAAAGAGPRVSLAASTGRPFPGDPDLLLVDGGALSGDETAYRTLVAGAPCVSACAPFFGSMKIGAAFHAAAAVLMIRQQVVGACPDAGSAGGLPVPRETGRRRLDAVRVVSCDCAGRPAWVELRREPGSDACPPINEVAT
jgi:3-oxoacyl-[acyl-carrier-protein] synthase II